MAIDYGMKRTGIAVTDPLKIIATGLTTIQSNELIPFLKKYQESESIERFIIGLPKNWDESDTHGTLPAKKAIEKIKSEFPLIPVTEVDERFTSKMARDSMVEMNLKKKLRKDKKLVDEIAATIILQEYMNTQS